MEDTGSPTVISIGKCRYLLINANKIVFLRSVYFYLQMFNKTLIVITPENALFYSHNYTMVLIGWSGIYHT